MFLSGNSGMGVAAGFWQISESVLAGKGLADTFHQIVDLTAQLLNLELCFLMTIDEQREELRACAVHGSPVYLEGNRHSIVKAWEGVSGQAIKEKKPVEIPDVRSEDRRRFPEVVRMDGLMSLVSVPIQSGKKILGVLNSYTAEKRSFTEGEIALLKAFAGQAALAIQNDDLRKQRQVARDALEEQRLLDQAKFFLMETKGLAEQEASDLLKQTSDKYGKPLKETAEAVVLTFLSDVGKSRTRQH